MKGIRFPDYDASILNLVASIAGHFGVRTGYGGLKVVEPILAKAPPTVVLMVFDGMGAAALERDLPPGAFLRRNQAGSISTVFPSTTVAAMTSFFSGLSPLEHGWLGWYLYFKEYARTIDTFLDCDTYAKTPIGVSGVAWSVMPYSNVYERIADRPGGSVAVYTVNPANIERSPTQRRLAAGSLEEYFAAIAQACEAPGRKLVVAYWPEPDGVMHDTGPYSPESVAMIGKIDAGMAALASSVHDALFLVTADHGQTEIDAGVDLASIPEIAECLAIPPFIESRAASCFLVPGSEKRFAKAFMRRFGGEYALFSRREVLRRGFLGRGTTHPKVSDFLGDYLAVGVGHTLLSFQSRIPRIAPPSTYKGHHAGMSPEEMRVPLIVIES